MDLLKTQLKNNAEVVIRLLERDVDNAFGFSEEMRKSAFIENFKKILEFSTSNIEAENKDYIQDLIIMTSCVRLQFQVKAYLEYVAPSIISWIKKFYSTVFVSFNLVKQTTLMEGTPVMLASEFYNCLLEIDDLYVKESLSLIESSNNALLTEELYYAIKNKNCNEFKRCLNERSANISTASRYLNILLALKKLINLVDIKRSNNNTLDGLSYGEAFTYGKFNSNLIYIMQFDNDNCTDKSCKELELAVTYILSYYNKFYKALCTDRGFGKYIIEVEERWIDLCYNGITEIEIFDDEIEEQMFITLFEIIRIGNINVCGDDNNNESCCTEGNPEDYPMCLKFRSKLLEEQNINHISEDFLQRNFYEHPDIECIKYVFFGLGIKPSEDLLWKGKKKDLTAFISYLCNGRVDSEVWGYFSNYIKQPGKEDKGIYDGVGPSTSASKEYKEEFAEYFEKKYSGMTE